MLQVSGAGVVRGVDGGGVGCSFGVLMSVRGSRAALTAHGASGSGSVVVGAAADVVLEPVRA